MTAATRASRVTTETAAEFVTYAIEHGSEHDDSFADADELREFDPAQEIAFVACAGTGGSDAIVGAASLMVRGYREEGLGRFRIIHALAAEDYEPLVDAVLGEVPNDIDHIFGFFFDGAPAIEVLAGLGFAPTRYAIVLRRPDIEVAAPSLSEGTALATARAGADDQAWADVVNAAFAGNPGRYDMSPEEAGKWLADGRLLPDGAIVARRDDKTIGVAYVGQYDEDGGTVVWIDQLAVIPEAQGQGVGRALLRAAISVARSAGFPEVDLSTGQANERALSLYTREGFEVTRKLVCLGRDLRR